MLFDVKSIKYPKNYQLVNFIHNLGPHGHRDWPSDKKSINKIIEKFIESPSMKISILKDNSNILGYRLIEREVKIDRSIISIGTFDNESFNLLLISAINKLNKLKKSNTHQIHIPLYQKKNNQPKSLNISDYKKVRKYLKMSIETHNFITPKLLDNQFKISKISSSKTIKELIQIQNEIFEPHWGYSPNTICDFSNKNSYSFFITNLEGEIYGFFTTNIVQENKKIIGKISMIGTKKEFRGKGIGKFALTNGIFFLKNKGASTINLDVDSENSHAISMYENIGFVTNAKINWWEYKNI